MFSFNVNFGGMNGQLEMFDCFIDIEVSGDCQRRRMQAPRIMIEQQFLSACQEIAQMNAPAKIKLSRTAQCSNDWSDKIVEREVYIMFRNNACVKEEDENN